MHPLDGCRAKIERASLHLREFGDRVRSFTDQAPYKVRGEHHSDTNEIVFVAEANHACPPIPLDLALIAGEVAHQLRSALDHLVWQLVVAHTGQPPQGTKSGFPIFKTEAGYQQRAGSMIVGVSDRARERIRAAQPFHLDGDAECALTWVVHELNNTDKHRLIPVAVEHTSVGSVVMTTDDGVVTELLPWQEHVREPLRDGVEVARAQIPDGASGAQFDIPLGFDVAFEQLGDVRRHPASDLLEKAVRYVNDLVESFRGEFPRDVR